MAAVMVAAGQYTNAHLLENGTDLAELCLVHAASLHHYAARLARRGWPIDGPQFDENLPARRGWPIDGPQFDESIPGHAAEADVMASVVVPYAAVKQVAMACGQLAVPTTQ